MPQIDFFCPSCNPPLQTFANAVIHRAMTSVEALHMGYFKCPAHVRKALQCSCVRPPHVGGFRNGLLFDTSILFLCFCPCCSAPFADFAPCQPKTKPLATGGFRHGLLLTQTCCPPCPSCNPPLQVLQKKREPKTKA